MARYSDIVRDENGVPLPGALVLVQNSSTGDLAVLTDDSGFPLANPVRADALGGFAYNVADDYYDNWYTYGGRLILKDRRIPIGTVVIPAGSVVDSLGSSTIAAPSQNAVLQAINAFSLSAGASLIGLAEGGTVQSMLSGLRQRSVTEFMTPTQIADVTSGTPTLDVSATFIACAAWCSAHRYTMFIPRIDCLLGQKITTLPTMSIKCDPAATLTWTSTSNCGWVIDGLSLGIVFGHAEIMLPQLIGPNDISGYYTTPKVYDVSTYLGTGLQIKDSAWCTVSVQYLIGWGVAFEMTATTVPTDNHDISLGTIDLCAAGLQFNSPAGSGVLIGQSFITTLNVFAYKPFNFIGTGAGSFQLTIESTSAFVNQVGGCIFNFAGTAPTLHTIEVGTVQSGYSADSPQGTPTTFHGRICGGDKTVLGETGWALIYHCFIEISMDGTEYVAGDTVPIKLGGGGSRIVVWSPQTTGISAITPSSTAGEANYNGGIGGAAVTRWTPLALPVTALAAGASKNFYFYHTRLNPSDIVGVSTNSMAGATPATDITVNTINNSASVNREVIVQITNRTGGAITGTYNIMAGIE